MRWRDLDLDSEKTLWVIPAQMNKAGRANEVPLAPEVVEILRSCDTDKKRTGEFIFSTPAGRRPISGFGKAKSHTDKHVAEMAANEDCKPIEENWRIHDLRRTAATGMAKLNTPLHVLASILNHSPGAAQGITAIYNRYEYGHEKRMALEAWARHVHGLVDKRQGNVVALHR